MFRWVINRRQQPFIIHLKKVTMTHIGIDYSLTSPAVTVHNGNHWDYNNCTFHFFLSEKKIKLFEDVASSFQKQQFFPYLYPEVYSSDIDRYNCLANWVMDIVDKCDKIDSVTIEGYAFGASASRIFNIAENTAVLKQCLFMRGVPFEVVPPTVIKKWATGKGNANKLLLEDTFESEHFVGLRNLLGQSEKQFNPSSDIIDSYFICSYGFNEYTKEINLNETN